MKILKFEPTPHILSQYKLKITSVNIFNQKNFVSTTRSALLSTSTSTILCHEALHKDFYPNNQTQAFLSKVKIGDNWQDLKFSKCCQCWIKQLPEKPVY